MARLDEIEQLFQQTLKDGVLALDLPELHAPELPAVVWPAAALAVQAAQIARTGTRLTVQGRVTHSLFGEVALTLALSQEGASVAVEVDIAPKLASVDLVRLAQALSLPLPKLPKLAALAEPVRRAALVLRGQDARLTTAADVGALGTVRLVLARVDRQWGLVAGLQVDKGLSFSDLHDVLRPLDALLSLVAWGDPALLVSTVKHDAFPYPGRAGTWETRRVEPGIQLRGELVLQRPELSVVRTLLGVDRLPLQIPLDPDLSQVRVRAQLGDCIALIEGCLTLEDLQIELAPKPLAVAASGRVSIELFGAKLPPFVLAANLASGGPSLSFRTAQPWKNPLGIPIQINVLVFEVLAASASYGLSGQIGIQNKTVDLAARFTSSAPTVLACKLDGEFSLLGVLKDLLNTNLFQELLPDALDPKLSDFSAYFVLDPRGAEVGALSLPPGVVLAGRVSFLGLSLQAEVQVSKKRVKVAGALKEALKIGDCFSLSDPKTPSAGPSLLLDTGSRPVGVLNAKVTFLGISQAVAATLSKSGFTCSLNQSLGPVKTQLDLALQDASSVLASGKASVKLKASIGPIRAMKGRLSLGTLNLDATLAAQLAVKLGLKTKPSVTVSARFKIMGIGFVVPEFTVSIQSLAELPAALVKALRDGAMTIFAAVFKDPDRWIAALGKKLISSVADAGHVLVKHFGKTTKEATHALRVTLKLPAEVVAGSLKKLGETPERIADLLSGVGDGPEAIAKALLRSGHPVKVVGKVLKGMNHGAKEVAAILKKAGVSPKLIGKVLGGLFSLLPWPF